MPDSNEPVTEAPISPAVRAFLDAGQGLLIGGEWLAAADGAMLETPNPATGAMLARVPRGGAADVDKAARAARRAFEDGAWPALMPAERERLILKLADLVETHADTLAELESLDNGKAKGLARAVDVAGAVNYLRYMAGFATKIEGRSIQPSINAIPNAKFHAYTTPEPVGVVGQIIPWNFPFLMAIWKLAPALACGCTCVLKPAEETPLTALYLGKLVGEAGFPPGVVNVITGLGTEAGAAITEHPEIDKVAFTGSTEVGKIINRTATESMKRVSLELGGKSPVVIMDDVDLKTAVKGAAMASFFNHGQVCTAGSRLYIHERIYDDVIAGLAEAARGMTLGSGLDPKADMGPLVSEAQQKRVLDYIEAGRGEGAEIVAGGNRPDRPGFFVEPTVFAACKGTMRIVREEIFGPVVAAESFADADEAVAKANDCAYGLAASVWTNNLSNAHRLTSRIKAGTVWVNCHNLVDASLPFGGMKQSGFGREHGAEAIRLYTELKTTLMAL
ncbi:aldehyde dehydrogenase family protein [Yunchengibacter salinarum]|uniref:aldehyde dehydrogenase family protein n=1 Tax=Yunchengibacter salinarum TaxID=3133399 RepID=UPI0035B59F96